MLIRIAVALIVYEWMAFGADNSVTISSSTEQTNRPVTISRVFKQGEIFGFPKPVIGNGENANAQLWQANVLSRYPDTSVKHALISFVHTLPKGSVRVAFTGDSTACHAGDQETCNAAGFTQEQMLAFNESAPSAGDGWGFSTEAAAAWMSNFANAREMIAAGHWRKWITGPVVDIVIVEDRTPSLSYDFGWRWDGTKMIDCTFDASGCREPYSQYKSLHPIFVLTFYHGWSGVKGEHILENCWIGKRQDQRIGIVLRSGPNLENVQFTAPFFDPVPIVEVEGARPMTITTSFPHGLMTGQVVSIQDVKGNLAANGNWVVAVKNPTEFTIQERGSGTYVPGTGVVGPFLQIASSRWRKIFWSGLEPESVHIDYNFEYIKESKVIPNYDSARRVSRQRIRNSKVAFDASDRGEIGGFGTLSKSFSGTEEGGIVQSNEIQYLYTFDSDAYAILFGTEVNGGGGHAAVSAHYPIHYREDSSGAFRDRDEDDTPDTDEAFGRILSVDFRPMARTSNNSSMPPAVGVESRGGWNLDAAHHHDRPFIAYLITGDWYFLEEMYFFAGWNIAYGNPDKHIATYRHANWGLVPSSSTREIAWGLRQLSHAAFFAPDKYLDGTEPNAEKEYFNQKIRFNIAAREGNYDIRDGQFFQNGTTCTIDAEGLNCPGYNLNSERSKWIWGRMTQSGTHNPLAYVRNGIAAPPSSCCVDTEQAGLWDAPWHEYYVTTVLGHMEELGFPTRKLKERLAANLIQRILDPSYNPYLIDLYEAPVGTRSLTLFKDWASALAAVKLDHRHRRTWAWASGPEAYVFRARSALSFMTDLQIGPYSGKEAWDWLESALRQSDLSQMDDNPKNAIIPRPGAR